MLKEKLTTIILLIKLYLAYKWDKEEINLKILFWFCVIVRSYFAENRRFLYLTLHVIGGWSWRVFRDGDNRVRSGVRLTIKLTLLSLDASITDVPIKQHRSEVEFDSVVSNILMPFANMSPSQALRSRLYSVDTCTMIFNNFSYQRCPYNHLNLTNWKALHNYNKKYISWILNI